MKDWEHEPRDVVAFMQNSWFLPRVPERLCLTYRCWYYAF